MGLRLRCCSRLETCIFGGARWGVTPNHDQRVVDAIRARAIDTLWVVVLGEDPGVEQDTVAIVAGIENGVIEVALAVDAMNRIARGTRYIHLGKLRATQ